MTLLQNQQLNDDDLELLSAYIDNQLMDGERGALEERLRHEPNLRIALEELSATVTVLRDLEPLRPPRSFTLDPVAFAPRPSPWFGWMRLGATLASVLLALTFAVDLFRLGNSGGTASAPAAAAPTAAPAAMAERSAFQATVAPDVMSQAAEAPTVAPMAPPAPAAAEPAAEPPAAPAAIEPVPTAAAAAEAPAAGAALEATAAPAATVAPLMAPAEAPTPTLEATNTQNSDTTLEAPAADAQPSAMQPEEYDAPPIATAAPETAGGQAPATQEPGGRAGRETQPLGPFRLLQIGLAALALLLGLGALWARRQSH